MDRFIESFVEVWTVILEGIPHPTWEVTGTICGVISVVALICGVFFFFCLYLPYRYDLHDRKQQEMDPNNPYYGKDI
ncbi:MAG: hypothetical protein KAR39_07530 [Thermoplasmata archaeon]|nr:hypothetical protein [Thermoplasmata archaeon]